MLTDKIKANGDLFGFELDDGQLIPFKLLNYREYKSLIHSLGSGNPTPEIIFDYIFNKCVLDTVLVDIIEEQQAGLVQTLGELILSLSGPGDKEFLTSLLDQARACTGTVELQIKATICRVFPGYTMDKLDELTFPKLVQVFAQAERVMLDSGVIEEPFRISIPSEPDDVEPGQGVIKNADITKLKTALGK
jgi:hypothetical protein